MRKELIEKNVCIERHIANNDLFQTKTITQVNSKGLKSKIAKRYVCNHTNEVNIEIVKEFH